VVEKNSLFGKDLLELC